MRLFFFPLLLLILSSCGSSDKMSSRYVFSPSVLPVQEYTVNNEKDTILKTLHGSLISISKGSFASNDPVKLTIKEAISPAEIFAAGLITESDGRPLGSGGMIYINTLEQGITLLKPLKVSIPTTSFEPAMQVFKGVETDSGRINWTDPQPLDSTPLQNSIALGKAIFRSKCIACHNIFRKMTGPELAGLESRGPWKDRKQLASWINNPARFMGTNRYVQNLKNEYGSMMTGFPDINLVAVNGIADYIKSETNRPGAFEEELLYRTSERKKDSSSVPSRADTLNLNDTTTTLYPDSNNCNPSTVYLPVPPAEPVFLDNDSSVSATNSPATEEASASYDFTIDTLGWYNVDFFLNGFPGTWITQVQVAISNQDETGPVILNLFSPRNRLMLEAVNEEKNLYRFNKIDNGAPLFLQDRAILLAYTSKNNKLFYAIKEFTVRKNQSFSMTLKESSESDLLKALKKKKIDNTELDLTIAEKRVIYRPCGETGVPVDTLKN